MASKEEIESKIYQLVGYTFNISSNKQLIKALYEDMALPVIEKTSAGNPSTTEVTLKKLAKDYPIAQLIIDYKQASRKNPVKEENVAEKEENAPKKAPKPGMPQPRQVLERSYVIDELNLAPDEIIRAELEKEDAKLRATVVSVAKEIPEVSTELPETTAQETESVTIKDQDTLKNTQETSAEEAGGSSYKEQKKTVQISDSSYAGKSSFSIIKKSGNNKSADKKKFDIDDNTTPENEFSKNSAVLNVRKDNTEDPNKEQKSRMNIYLICLVVILFAICIFIYINSLNTI
ncbi:MAG: DNA polymerase [Succinivibrionaceae bacterium]